MAAGDGFWAHLRVSDQEFADVPVGADGVRVVNLRSRGGSDRDRPARWLTVSMIALGVLAAASPRVLNVGAVVTSVAMNVLASGPGWRNLAIWAMPPVAYALASDTAIGVVRAWTIARQNALNQALADDDATPLAILGGLLLWLLRLTLAPASTLGGFRRWVLEECPVAPGRRAGAAASPAAAVPQATRSSRKAIASRTAPGTPRSATNTPRPAAKVRPGTKTQRFLDLVAERHGPLSQFPLANVSRVCTVLAPEVDLNPGAARTALRRHVQAARASHADRASQAAQPARNGSAS